jgi:exonuclease SbcD
MRILHTSDWHLGQSLNRYQRYAEFADFLAWLATTIEQEKVDALLVAGDIFDTTTPGNRAQELYYRFLCRVAASCCRNVVITAGNHDSPTLLEAPKELLRIMNIHVIGNPPADPADEVILLYGQNNKPAAIVCSVPYLRDRDIRTSQPGESIQDKSANLIAGIKQHYALVAEIASGKQVELGDLPIIGMGHLFTAGGQTRKDDGTRELYVGNLAHINAGDLPPCFDYLALGHLHQPQKVSGKETWRYSGSPVPMSFAEADQQKMVLLVDFDGKTPHITELEVPKFQPLEKISGNLQQLSERLNELKESAANTWLEIEFTGDEIVSDLPGRLQEMIAGSNLEIRIIRNKILLDKVLQQNDSEETLDDISIDEVFLRCLDSYEIPQEQRTELLHSYQEIVKEILEEDVNAN